MKLIFQIAAGIILATTVITWSGFALMAYMAELEVKEIQELAARQQQEARQAQEVAERRRLQAEAQKRAQTQARITAQREQKARERAARAAKDRAWAAFYQHPEDCLVPRSEARNMECINQKIRARREFNEQYSP